MKRIVVIGTSISGGIASCYLKLRFPDLEVVAIQKGHAKFPIVGESLTEFSTLMLREIGLGPYLEEQHFHKYGLTFYFKENIDNPADNRYAAHEATRIPPLPSNQINRFALAKRLTARAAELDVSILGGKVCDVSVGGRRPNRVLYTAEGGETVALDADWIIDASGRNRVLATKLGLKKPPRFQRSSFWFRLADFDKDILKEMEAVKTPQHCFDSYYVTHHFFGRYNWIWAIPMRPDQKDCRDLISIGIVYRPDLYQGEVTTLESFLARVGNEHPVVAKLVRSGRILDTNTYRNYFYETERSYSASGWLIVGDAGDTVDPLYSTGLAMTSIQVKQAAAIIEADLNGTLTDEFVRDLETLYKTIRNSLQLEISKLYEVMDDPFQSHLRMHCASAFYFFVLLPSWLNGYITDPVGARMMTRILEDAAGRSDSLRALLGVASQRTGPLPASAIKNLYDQTVNWRLAGPSEERMPQYFAKCALFFARTRFHALRRAGWHNGLMHLRLCAGDVGKAILFGVIMRRTAIRRLKLVRRIVGV